MYLFTAQFYILILNKNKNELLQCHHITTKNYYRTTLINVETATPLMCMTITEGIHDPASTLIIRKNTTHPLRHIIITRTQHVYSKFLINIIIFFNGVA